jgi:hypothetical protein
MKYFCLIFVWCFSLYGTSQCGLSKTSYTIADFSNEKADTTNIPILISGATYNNLATPQQGLCGVKLKFRHPFMKDLRIELISPGGQKITLVGGTYAQQATSLITWDVTFVPCQSTPSPDPGILPQWESDQQWEIPQIYTGQYHPHIDCLEKFDLGTVNGVWTLRCIDTDDDGFSGALLGAQLIYCQTEGLQCNDCNIDPGTINNPNIAVCEKDPALLININKTYTSPVQNNNVYEYTNVIFNESSIIKYEKSPDLRMLAPGTYTICGIQYARSQSSVLPLQGASISPDGLRQLLFERGACAGLSKNCMTVTISVPPSIVKKRVSICDGQVFEIGGQKFSQQGNYSIKVKGPICDTTVVLDLEIIRPKAQIIAPMDSLNCANPTMVLQGINSGTILPDVKYLWKTINGTILGDSTQPNLIIGKEGNYNLVITSQQSGCTDSISKTIFRDNSFINMTFTKDTLTCQKKNVTIRFTLSRPVIEQQWTSRNNHPFTILSNGINVTESDWYVFTVKGLNGCISVDSVFIGQNIGFTDPMIEVNKITCIADTAYVKNVHNVSATEYQYTWTGVAPQYTNVKEPFFLTGGNYQLRVLNRTNGCNKDFDILIETDKKTPTLSLTGLNIDCDKSFTTPIVQSNHSINKYKWSGNGFTSTSAMPEIKETGRYQVTITSGVNGCLASSDFNVTRDVDVPILKISANKFSCKVDSVTIRVQTNKELKQLTWTGPGGFKSKFLEPVVSGKGKYTIEYEGINGCFGVESIILSDSTDIPNIQYIVDSLTCGKDTIKFVAFNPMSEVNSFTYTWTGPNGFSSVTAEPLVWNEGQYAVTIKNPTTDCEETNYHFVMDRRAKPSPNILIDTINCKTDSARILFTNDDIKSLIIKGENFESTSKLFFTKKTGVYEYSLVNVNNCETKGSFEVLRNDTIPNIQANFSFFICKQDSVRITGSSTITGTQFSWRNDAGYRAIGQEVFTYKGGTYSVEGTAPNGCKSKVDFTIGYDTLPLPFKILKPDTITCTRKEITLLTNLVQPKGKLRWNNRDSSFFNFNVKEPGRYYAEYTSENNCTSTDTVLVAEKTNFPGYDVESSIITCKNLLSSVKVIPKTPNNEIIWKNVTNPIDISNGTFSFNTSFGGEYTFYLTNPEGCETEGLLVILSDTIRPKIVQHFSDSLTCKNLVTDIGVVLSEKAIEYQWNGPGVIDVKSDSVLRVNQGGWYFLKITGRNQCVTNTQFNVLKNVDLPKFSTFTDTLTCDNAKINIGVHPVSNIAKYEWDGPDAFLSEFGQPKVFIPGTYSVTVTGFNGCKDKAEIKVIQNITKPQIFMPDTVILTCDTSPILLTFSTSSTIEKYKWVYPDGEILNIKSPQTNIPGNYLVQATSKNGCTSVLKKFNVKVNDIPPKYTITMDTINCAKNYATLKVLSTEPGFKSVWVSPSKMVFSAGTINTSEAGEFTLMVTNQEKCTDTAKVNIIRDTLVPFNSIAVKGRLQCEIKSLNLEGTKPANNVTPKWSTSNGNFLSSPNSSSVRVNKSGLYFYELKNSVNKCISISQVEVKEVPQEFTNLNVDVVTPTCSEIDNGILILSAFNGSAPYAVEVNGVKKGSQTQFFNLDPGDYKIMVTDSFGCNIEKQVVIPQGPVVSFKIDKEKIIKFGDSILLKPELGPDPLGKAVVKWKQGDKTICNNCKELMVNPLVNTVYNVEYSLDGFCKLNAAILVRVENDIEAAIPNVFAPFSLGSNQFFYIPQTRGIEKINYIKIFNRWAENVYSGYDLVPGDISTGWNGLFNGKQVQPGVFVVLVELVLSDGTIWKYKGDVTVIR